MLIREEEYRLKFFLERGFTRKKCNVCGTYFWTLDHDRTNCGDSPCMSYRFIGKPPFRKLLNLREVRNSFLKFFEKHGHTIIKPYSVVAKWRDDLYLTIASVALFQPFVTEGVVPPPANPLVVSQPCIRLSDIDRVGATAGRHLTIFEMGGAHAFNTKEEWKYWKDETVELCQLFLTEELGVRPEMVTYKEDFWEGGGNAGPDVEACIEGLELATLVFMTYKVKDGVYEEMPMKVVDTGYGIERFAWALAGQPTAFHSIYGPLLDRFVESLKVKESIDWKLVAEAVREHSSLPMDEGLKFENRVKIASKLGVDGASLDSMMKTVEKVCALLDHTKCLAFMLADGIVPSNSGEGYLARLVLRRALRMLMGLEVDVSLVDLVSWQLNYWASDYPRLKEAYDIVLEEVELEEEHYEEALKKGRRLVERRLNEIFEKGVKALIDLYDSHGIPPELVSQVAEERGIKIEAPQGFYAMVAKIHEKPTIQVEALKFEPPKLQGIPSTKTLFYENPYLTKFKAKVIKSLGEWIILDATCFYPEGGGQSFDTGIINFKDRKVKVLEVVKVGDIVLHRVDGELPEGVEVEGVVDEARRMSLMRHHTATHIIVGAARRLWGNQVWQAGAYKGAEYARIDLTFHRRLRKDELAKLETLVNEVVLKGIPVKTSFMKREQAEELHGLALYQGGVPPGRYTRVVDIAGWNAQACGGLHTSSTNEVGLIKILKAYRIQDGVERIEFSAGLSALKHIHQNEERLDKIAEALQVPIEKVTEAVDQMKDELKAYRKAIEKFREKLASHMAISLLKTSQRIGRINFVSYVGKDEGVEDLIKIGEEMVKRDPSAVCTLITGVEKASIVIMAGSEAVKAGVHAGKLANIVSETLDGKGGGRESLGQGGGPRLDKVKEALTKAKEVLETIS